MNIASIGAFRYFIIAIIVGFAQSVLDQGYWLKAKAAKNENTYIKAQIIGGLAIWIPITLCCSLVFGYFAYTGIQSTGQGRSFGELLTRTVFLDKYGTFLAILFSIAILCVVMTTMINCLLGVFSLASSEIYPNQITEKGSQTDALRFGKIFTVLTGGFCGLIALSLENISLLSIDTFSGIFFAAPCATLCSGILLRNKFGNQGLVATGLGILIGLSVWLYMDNTDLDGFVATILSFGVPIVYLGAFRLLFPEPFNVHSLKL